MEEEPNETPEINKGSSPIDPDRRLSADDDRINGTVVPLHENHKWMRTSHSGPRVLFKKDANNTLMSEFRRAKSNTTSSFYIKDTMGNPNVEEVLKCMSSALLFHLKNGEKTTEPALIDFFDERKFPLMPTMVDLSRIPEFEIVYNFVGVIFRVQAFPHEIAILALAYIERLISMTGICLHRTNWRRVTLGAILVASKIWEEQSVWNADFLAMFPHLNVTELNKLERTWLEHIQYNITLKASEYAKYYFELRALSTLDAEHFPLEPLTKEQEEKLEERSQEREAKVKEKRRYHSMDSAAANRIKSLIP
eukprot:TRINITY_DN15749_c0_g1_i1.p1 TRINITY_DN15749_c0_g1~~TRINITY_DN15749_c0_g1_i1.p1  ORF type:complete len:308 (+),score=65.90 TRINITY_DN15749_c0_g1_i1:151-1074(+)